MIIIVSGPGGVGKGTIVKALVERDPCLWLSRSWTTRAPRPHEDDQDYAFVTPAEFEALIAQDRLLEWNEFLGNYYGSPVPDPEVLAGRDVVLEIETNGAQQVKAKHPDALLIFVLPPSREEQERRLRGRGDPNDKVMARLRKAEQEEPVGRALADHVVVNDDLEQTIGELMDIIERARRR